MGIKVIKYMRIKVEKKSPVSDMLKFYQCQFRNKSIFITERLKWCNNSCSFWKLLIFVCKKLFRAFKGLNKKYEIESVLAG